MITECSDAQSCPTLCNPMECRPPGSCVHGILQARTLEWVAISSSRGSFQPRDQTHVSCVSCTASPPPVGRFSTTEPPPGKPQMTQKPISICWKFEHILHMYLMYVLNVQYVLNDFTRGKPRAPKMHCSVFFSDSYKYAQCLQILPLRLI